MAPIGSIMLIAVLGSVSANLHKIQISPTESSLEEAVFKWKQLENGTLEIVNNLMDNAMKMLVDSGGVEIDLSEDCIGDLLNLVSGIRKLKLWATKLLDANAKPAAGILMGSAGTYGSYDECLDVTFPSLSTQNENTVGKYCLLDGTPPLPPKQGILRLDTDIFKGTNVTFNTEVMELFRKFASVMYYSGSRFAVCVPSTCTDKDLHTIIHALLSSSAMRVEIHSCEVKTKIRFSLEQKISIGVLSAVAMFNFLGLFSVFFTKKSFLSIFDPVANWKAVFKTNNKPNKLSAVSGIRVITMLWVVLSHTYFSVDFMMFDHVNNYDNMRKDFWVQVIANGAMAVESFLLITSTLISYTLVLAFDQIGIQIFHVPILVAKRIWRLLPTELLVICITLLFPLLGSGPLWKDEIGTMSDLCSQRWWAVALFINNYFRVDEMCLANTWYVSLDLQNHIIFMLYFYLLFKFKTSLLANVLLVTLTLVSVLSSGIFTYSLKMIPAILAAVIDRETIAFFPKYLRINPYNHFDIYSIGTALGTILARRNEFKLSKISCVFGWTIASIAGVTAVYGVYPWNAYQAPTTLEAIAYSSLSRIGWALSLSWVIFVCGIGKGGLVNELLSWSGFQILTRISYALFLVHYIILFAYGANLKSTLTLSQSTFVYLFCGHLLISTIAAFAIVVFFEAPISTIGRCFFGKFTKPKPDGTFKMNTHSDKISEIRCDQS